MSDIELIEDDVIIEDTDTQDSDSDSDSDNTVDESGLENYYNWCGKKGYRNINGDSGFYNWCGKKGYHNINGDSGYYNWCGVNFSSSSSDSNSGDDGGSDVIIKSPEWKVRLNITEPTKVASDVTYSMIQTQSKIGDEFVYTYTIRVDVDQTKSTKYYIYISYTDENEEVKTKNTTSLYQTYDDGPIEITVSTYLDTKGEIQYILSNSKYLICDVNWTGLGYFDISKDGKPNAIYFNNTKQKGYVAIRNSGSPTTKYVPGGNSQYQNNLIVENNPGTNEGLYKATFDYSNSKLIFEKVTNLNIYIENYIPFVSSSNFTIPESVVAYKYSEYTDGILKLIKIDGNKIDANQPVILYTSQSGNYDISLTDEYNFNYIGEVTGNRAFISDSHDEGSVLYGVHQPHLYPTNSYMFDGEKFVKSISTNIISPLNCYVKVDDDVEFINVVFV